VGLDPNYPVVEINTRPRSSLVYDDAHQQVGRRYGARPRTNVFCNDVPSRNGWIPADQVHIFGEPPYPVPECQNISGCLRKTTTGAAAVAVAGGARWRRRRSRR
jgi:hypothetical protein